MSVAPGASPGFVRRARSAGGHAGGTASGSERRESTSDKTRGVRDTIPSPAGYGPIAPHPRPGRRQTPTEWCGAWDEALRGPLPAARSRSRYLRCANRLYVPRQGQLETRTQNRGPRSDVRRPRSDVQSPMSELRCPHGGNEPRAAIASARARRDAEPESPTRRAGRMSVALGASPGFMSPAIVRARPARRVECGPDLDGNDGLPWVVRGLRDHHTPSTHPIIFDPPGGSLRLTMGRNGPRVSPGATHVRPAYRGSPEGFWWSMKARAHPAQRMTHKTVPHANDHQITTFNVRSPMSEWRERVSSLEPRLRFTITNYEYELRVRQDRFTQLKKSPAGAGLGCMI